MRDIEAAGVPQGDISVVANNVDNRYPPTDIRGKAYRDAGWNAFDGKVVPFTTSELQRERTPRLTLVA